MDKSSSGLGAGEIAGAIVVPLLVLLAFAIVLVVIIMIVLRRRKHKGKQCMVILYSVHVNWQAVSMQ